MEEIITRQFNAQNVRIQLIEDEPWFCAIDCCKILQLSNSRNVRRDLDADEVLSVSIGRSENTGAAKTNFISESGLYKLIMRSRKAEAKAFQRWVTHDVLPSIRKTGQYAMPGLPTMLPEQTAALTAAAEAIVQRARRMLANRRWQLRMMMRQWGYSADDFKRIAAEAADVADATGTFDLAAYDVGAPTADDIRMAVDAAPIERTPVLGMGYLPPRRS